MKKILFIVVCVVVGGRLVLGHHDTKDIKQSDTVLPALHQQDSKGKNTSTSIIPEISCVLMKAFAYGFQKAMNEFTLRRPEYNLSNIIEDVDIDRYLDSYCDKYLVTYPNFSRNQDVHEDITKQQATVGHPEHHRKSTVKVKRHQQTQHELHMKSRPINETTPINNTNDPNLVSNQGNHLKSQKKTENDHEHDQLGRLLKSIEEVSNVIKSQLTRESHKESQSVLSATSSRKKQDSLQKPILNYNATKIEKTESKLESNANKTNSTVIPINNEFKADKNTADVKVEKGKHRHHHHHNFHNKNKATKTKSKAAPVENKMKDMEISEDEPDFSGDDLYVSAQLKLDEVKDKLKMKSNEKTKERSRNVKQINKQLENEVQKKGKYRSKRSVESFKNDKEMKTREKLLDTKVKQVKNAEKTSKSYKMKGKSYNNRN